MGRIDRASRVIEASADRLYAALTDGESRARWLPPEGMTGRMDRFDPRPGGGYRMTLTYDDPSAATGKTSADSDTVEGTFVELIPNQRIVEQGVFESHDPAFAGVMTVIWSLHAANGATRVDIEAHDVPPGISAEDHAAGLASSLDNLAAFVES